MTGLNDKQRVEYLFNHARFMSDVKLKLGGGSLRNIEAATGVSASTLSRIGKGQVIEMATFLAICGRCQLKPEHYFDRQVWELKEG